LFELRNTYEMLLEFGSIARPVRIEIFRCIENQKLYRARIWDQCIYDLYPTFLNLDLKNSDLQSVVQTAYPSPFSINPWLTPTVSPAVNARLYAQSEP